ncbi:hypothetical protein [Brevibacillus laterosporus]|uniref:Uncharacterized protein n=1 Tax=Brevibacillus laterosporus TaxID=1465 RepID=A0AAP8QI10_BRELA|nr:hypothetical protein [Brevibacillus laterosporus]PPB12908.1 hypothetical protein C4A77_00545 [Brevibacillus laterosporus]
MNQEIRDMIEMFFFITLIFALGGLAVQGVCLIFGIPLFSYLQSVGVFTAIIFFLIFVATTT